MRPRQGRTPLMKVMHRISKNYTLSDKKSAGIIYQNNIDKNREKSSENLINLDRKLIHSKINKKNLRRSYYHN